MRDLTLGFALCGSFCTFEKAFEQMRRTAAAGYQLLPIMSNNAYETDTRFGRAADLFGKRRISAAERWFIPFPEQSLLDQEDD